MWKRPILNADHAKPTAEALQSLLPTLVDTGLSAKQAHWNVFGQQFLSVHEKLDEVVASARNFGDLVAERIVKLGFAADGRRGVVAEGSKLPQMSSTFEDVPSTLKSVCDCIATLLEEVRSTLEAVEKHDPPTEDLCIEILREFEEHQWMLQAMEGVSPAN